MDKRHPKLKRVGTALALAALLCLTSARAAQVAAPSQPAGSPRPLYQVEVALSAQAALAIDLTTGVVLYEREADTPLPPASTAKLLTALVARDQLALDEQVTIEERDLVPEEFSRMGVLPGDVLNVEQLLYGALIPSGGDASLALARVAGTRLDPAAPDPVARFVQEMNALAAALGMGGSSFGNPVGMDDEQSWTTARDLARAADAIFDDPLLSRVVGTQWADISVGGPNAREFTIENSNQFVLFDGAIGVKTGTTDDAGQNLVNAFRYGDHVILTVVLGSGDRYLDTTAMLDGIGLSWQWLSLGRQAPSLGATEELELLGLWMPVGRTVMVATEQLDRFAYEILLDDDASGRSRGVVRYSLDDQLIAELPVYPQGAPAEQ